MLKSNACSELLPNMKCVTAGVYSSEQNRSALISQHNSSKCMSREVETQMEEPVVVLAADVKVTNLGTVYSGNLI